jgi:hypothetical protein
MDFVHYNLIITLISSNYISFVDYERRDEVKYFISTSSMQKVEIPKRDELK